LRRPIGPAHDLDRAQLQRLKHSPSGSESCPKRWGPRSSAPHPQVFRVRASVRSTIHIVRPAARSQHSRRTASGVLATFVSHSQRRARDIRVAQPAARSRHSCRTASGALATFASHS
jgi:hypothetical protein